MKAHFNILVLLFCLTNYTSIASVEFIDQYKKERGYFKTLTIPMSFDSDSILRRLPKIDASRIFRIDYIATSYSKKITTYQKYLNNKRWLALSSNLKLKDNMVYNKKEYYQIGAKNKIEAKKFFHGYVIYYGADPVKAHKNSFEPMKDLINKIAEFSINNYSKIQIKKSNRVDSMFLGDIYKKQKIAYDKKLITNNQVIEWGYDSIGVDKKFYGAYYILTKVSSGIFTAFCALKNRQLFDMMQRSKLNNKTLIVTDLTGSMYPYYSQLLVWQALKLSQGKHYKHVFFNDGNQKTDASKKIGETGGIYFSSSSNILHVYNSMNECMRKGGGGDQPENNMEAVLEGLNKYKNINTIIMVADNFATPRDGELIHSIKRPIHYVMCGTQLGINSNYINLSKHYEGSIVSVEKSISHFDAQ